jgi:pimeloyl-ACP methyl ester carboxylesterase
MPTLALDYPEHPIELYYEDHGDGRPVVLIHGWPLSAEAWAPQLPALQEAGYRTIAYDRRGFGRSDKPADGYDYDTLADDLAGILDDLDLEDATLVGFSMGGGEVARYVGNHGESRLRSVVFAAAVTPALRQGPGNPDGPLTPEKARQKADEYAAGRHAYYDAFTTNFFSANGKLMVSDAERHDAIALCEQADPVAAAACMDAFAHADFRQDLAAIEIPTLVLHGDADAIVPLEGSGARTHAAVAGSRLVVLEGAPHGCNLSHADAFNAALIEFLKR